MHGQNRKEYKARMRDSKVAEGLAQKAKQWYALSSELLVRRRHDLDVNYDKNNQDSDNDKKSIDNDNNNNSNSVKCEETLRLTEKLLTVNPDPSHLWNHRRTLLLHLTSSSPSPLPGKEFLEKEQIVTATCLQRNPKAYGAWFHRKWSIRHYLLIELRSLQSHSDTDPSLPRDASSHWKIVLERELDLCAQFLDLDERNFHCWNYRRFVVSSLAFVLHLCSLFSSDDEGTEPTSMPVLYQRAHLLLQQLDGSWTWSYHNNQQQQQPESNLNSHSTILMGSQLTQHGQVPNPILAPTLSQLDEQYLLRKEWDFTKEKIEQNFSNCSAFHYRSKLLPLVLDNRSRRRSLRQPHNKEPQDHYNDDDDDDSHDLNESHESSDKDNHGEGSNWKEREAIHIARKELELVQNAIFTEPDDQTAWWYHRFIVSWANPMPQTTTPTTTTTATKPPSRSTLQSYLELLEDEHESIQELIDAEDGMCKWGYLALHMVSNAQISTFGALKLMTVEKDDIDDNDRDVYDYDECTRIVREEANQCLVNLEKLDPDRIVRYQDMVQ